MWITILLLYTTTCYGSKRRTQAETGVAGFIYVTTAGSVTCFVLDVDLKSRQACSYQRRSFSMSRCQDFVKQL